MNKRTYTSLPTSNIPREPLFYLFIPNLSGMICLYVTPRKILDRINIYRLYEI